MYHHKNSFNKFDQLKQYLTLGEGSSGRSELLPLFIKSGKGSKVYDIDSNEYIDYVLAYGPLILGHSHPAIVKAISDQVNSGTIFGFNHELEIEVSKKIVGLIPSIEQVRFNSTGTEAVQSAIRIARTYTGKEKILKFVGQYHGWLDNILISGAATKQEDMGSYEAPNAVRISKGQPKSVLNDVVVAHWNDLDQVNDIVKRHKGEIAAILTEPMMTNAHIIPPKPGYLEGLRQISHENEILLIFDEVVSGFRLGLRGGQGYFNVSPDITVFGKALGGGLPVSCFGASKEIMSVMSKSGAIQLGTFNTNPLCMAGANATLDELSKNDGNAYKQMNKLGKTLQAGITSLIEKFNIQASIQGTESLFAVLFTREPVDNYQDIFKISTTKMLSYRQYLYSHGIMVRPELKDIWYLSSAHSETDIDSTLNILEDAFQLLK